MITRTITATTIESSNITFEKGTPVITLNAPVTVSGVVDGTKALKEVRKLYGATANVTALKEVNDVYEISVEDFMKHATKVKAPAPELTPIVDGEL